MKKNSILLIGEHALLRAFLRAWLARFKNLVVVAESDNAKQTMALVARHKPALVLMDFETLQSISLDILTKLRIKFPHVKVIIYFAYAHDNIAIKVIRAGAAGYVVKSADSAEMENAIHTVLGGGVYLSPEFLQFVGTVEGLTDVEGKVLSPRQTEILKLIALGLSTKSIAYELKLSGKTVDVHKLTLVTRLGLKKSNELFKYAVAAGLVSA
jgi:DNA-binding NarL/FixJ family response regulator